jgi:hypothetical protein
MQEMELLKQPAQRTIMWYNWSFYEKSLGVFHYLSLGGFFIIMEIGRGKSIINYGWRNQKNF